jgi:hypothetical protein
MASGETEENYKNLGQKSPSLGLKPGLTEYEAVVLFLNSLKKNFVWQCGVTHGTTVMYKIRT